MKKLFALVALLFLIGIGYAYDTPLEYMKWNNLTDTQANYVLEKSKDDENPALFYV